MPVEGRGGASRAMVNLNLMVKKGFGFYYFFVIYFVMVKGKQPILETKITTGKTPPYQTYIRTTI